MTTQLEEGMASRLPSEPPPLPYSLRTRKKSIAIFWTIFIIDTLGQPLILYWTLWYLTDLSHNLGMLWRSNLCVEAGFACDLRRALSVICSAMLTWMTVFSVVTAAIGGVSVFEYFYRLYNLRRKESRARPLNAQASWVRYVYTLGASRTISGTDASVARLFPHQFYPRLVNLGR